MTDLWSTLIYIYIYIGQWCRLVLCIWPIRITENLRSGSTWYPSDMNLIKQKIEIFVWSRISKFLRPAQRYDNFKLINCCRPTCRCHHLGYSVPPALHRTIWCGSTFGPRGPGLSNPTSFLRPALPMAPTRDDNARDKRSVLRPNPATFLRDFALYMTMKYAV